MWTTVTFWQYEDCNIINFRDYSFPQFVLGIWWNKSKGFQILVTDKAMQAVWCLVTELTPPVTVTEQARYESRKKLYNNSLYETTLYHKNTWKVTRKQSFMPTSNNVIMKLSMHPCLMNMEIFQKELSITNLIG